MNILRYSKLFNRNLLQSKFLSTIQARKLLLKSLVSSTLFLANFYMIKNLNNFLLTCLSVNNKEYSFVHHASNDPIEDRYTITSLANLKGGIFLAVYDGHGGYSVSDLASKKLHLYFDEILPSSLKESDSEQTAILDALRKSFSRLELELKEKAIETYRAGDGKAACVGACALVAVVYNNTVYIANLGDSKANIFRWDDKISAFYPLKIMHRHNSEKPREKEALYKRFPNEKDIVKCKRDDGTVCYVKGRLQPTRSFGDFHLKYKEFNVIYGSQYKTPIENFNGPYISAVPEMTVIPIDSAVDKYLLLATDGLCDFMKSDEVSDLITQAKGKGKEITAEDLLSRVYKKAASEAYMTVDQLNSIPPGRKRRNLIDDTTIILMRL